MKQEQPPGDMGLNEIQENGSTFGNLNSAIILKDRGQVFSLSVLPECSVHTSEVLVSHLGASRFIWLLGRQNHLLKKHGIQGLLEETHFLLLSCPSDE
ncbi:psychosine receptor isoform X2 [Panthera leo]|uniref:psychosine receptor isoform X2 n=1 Tax=Panthera leo TaxID=9689 RepID=UPI001C69CDF5|nr:psychosine receptor isoform X2 [Panthera leo]XP_042799938.1 psychosine receptor isoform X2 [Panthera leo]XP_042799939.1 psychosine receptor isoform X2 [Panthera leo]